MEAGDRRRAVEHYAYRAVPLRRRDGRWTLFWPDSNDQWHKDDAPPTSDVARLLDVVDRDPTGIYWG